MNFDDSFLEVLDKVSIGLGDAVMSGPSPGARIGHILKIDEVGVYVYFSDTENVKVWDGMTAKIARRSYLKRYPNESQET